MLDLISEPMLFRHFPLPNSALRQEWRKSDTHTFLLFRFLPSVNLWTTVQTKQRWMSNTQFIGSRSKSRKEDIFAVHCSRVNLMTAKLRIQVVKHPIYIVPCHLSTPWLHPHEVVRRLLTAAAVSLDEVFLQCHTVIDFLLQKTDVFRVAVSCGGFVSRFRVAVSCGGFMWRFHVAVLCAATRVYYATITRHAKAWRCIFYFTFCAQCDHGPLHGHLFSAQRRCEIAIHMRRSCPPCRVQWCTHSDQCDCFLQYRTWFLYIDGCACCKKRWMGGGGLAQIMISFLSDTRYHNLLHNDRKKWVKLRVPYSENFAVMTCTVWNLKYFYAVFFDFSKIEKLTENNQHSTRGKSRRSVLIGSFQHRNFWSMQKPYVVKKLLCTTHSGKPNEK